MPKSNSPGKNPRLLKFENFEQRLAMSAHSIAAEALIPQVQPEDIEAAASLQQQAAIVSTQNHLTSVNQVLAEYGFKGTGQTVAVIDSGIAWDHYALGGGLGAGHKVVGGWDFAESDANPYDDGSAGFHGTHVSGIIGSTDSTYKGVASGVDLVGLRVFDDAGQGNLLWVEQALRWVHEHRNAFENPITTVNLSLGSAWNADNVPNWATLEEEFAQLKQDGIFISVAAGNSFQSYNSAGLSYPAASQHVVPVASHNAAGNLSDFSQRNSRVLVAPGESIRSTVPDHLFGGSQTGQFLGASGTSMAAPWVAGASTLLREAYGFMGQTNIAQDDLYRTFRDSADQVFDSVTGGWYSRINLERAIASIVTDSHGNTASTATRLGTVSGGLEVEGVIGKVTDVDAFQFTAGRTGRMTLAFESSHELQARVTLSGQNLSWSGNSVSFDVIAGQSYDFSVSTADGIGHYRMTADVTGAVATDWGVVQDNQRSGLNVNGTSLYRMQAGQEGLMTIVGKATAGNLTFRVLDQNMQQIHAGTVGASGTRFDFQVDQTETLFVEISGVGGADLRLTNLVGLDSGKLSLHGTAGQDRIEIQTGGNWQVEVNGIAYSFSGAQVQQVLLAGGAEADLVEIRLGSGNHQVHIQENQVWVAGNGFTVNGSGFENAVVHAGIGTNRLSLVGSEGADRLENSGDMVSLVGAGRASFGIGFDSVYADSRGGNDAAQLNGTVGGDLFSAGGSWLSLDTGVSTLVAVQNEQVRFAGQAGFDQATLHGSSGDDQFTAGAARTSATISGVSLELTGIERANLLGGGGADSVLWQDSAGDDTFFARGQTSFISGGGFFGYAEAFIETRAISTAGNDISHLADSSGDDQAWMSNNQTVLVSANSRVTADGFSRVNIIASQGGHNVVNMLGTSGNDSLFSQPDATSLQLATGQTLRAVGFESVVVDGWGGADTAVAMGSQTLDRLSASSQSIRLVRGQGGSLQISNTSAVFFDGQSGADEVVFADLGSGDSLSGTGNLANARIGQNTVETRNFALLTARALAGQSPVESLREVDYLFMLSGQWQPNAT